MFWNNLSVAVNYFIEIAVELTVLFIGITFLVGLIQEYVSDETIKKAMGGQHKVVGSILGAGFGALTPFCSCSTIPMLLGMLNAGVPFAAAMAFLFSSPLLNPVIISLLIILLGWKVASLYFTVTFVAAIIISLLLDGLGFASQVKSAAVIRSSCDCQQTTDARSRIQRSAKFSFSLFRQLMPYLLIGAGIGAFIHGFVPTEIVSRFAGPENPLAVPVAAIVGIPLYIRAETMIPIGLALIEKGMSVGAVLGLVIGGAGASIPELALLSAIFKKRLLSAFVVTILIIAVTAGYLANLLTL
ncbi:permease [Methanosarcina sp.]|uniref:permease n=1 Tax=Methanosarcina sp. TaxID=2213 RepID=UPI0029890598|nr:permease [Methanosarcina sp.]MDW5550439.1 permease [Methanosarcina sp.]MDW5554763.1 permease [Methanosarcina sp.]MDW5559938.1 permease [Methanosarcina sp.]